jgi:hypothetical protein
VSSDEGIASNRRAGARQAPFIILVCTLAALQPGTSAAQAISVADTADRPGFADAPVLLGRGRIQLEGGFTSDHEGRSSDLKNTSTWPQVELHAGVSSELDVSIEWDGVVSTNTPAASAGVDRRATGTSDIRLGAKLALITRPHFDAALIGYVNFPVGNAPDTTGYANPVIRFPWAIGFTDRVGVFGTLDLGAEREDDHLVHAKPAASVSVAADLVASAAGFFGLVAESPDRGSTPDVWSLEGGLMVPVGIPL